MRRWWPLTVRGTGAAIAAAVCFVVAHEAGLIQLVYFGVLLCAVLAACLISLLLARRTEAVARALTPDIASVGRRSAVRVRVGMRAALPTAPGTWEDGLSAGLAGRAHGVFPAISSGLRGGDDTVELKYSVEGMSRGIHSLGPLAVTATDPFGLARRRYRLGGITPVTVAPAIIDLAPLPSAKAAVGGMLQAATTQLGQGADDLVARPYAPGDSMRRIHWRATAHRDTLMVRQEEQEASPEALVVLDRGALRWDSEAMLSAGVDPGFETAVSTAVSVLMRLVREGYTVEVIDSDGTSLGDPIAGGETSDAEALAASLATLTTRAGDDLPRLSALFPAGGIGPLVVVTGRLGVDDAEALAPLSSHSALPVLIGVGSVGHAVDRARGLGWQAADLAPDGDVARAWEIAVARGAMHVG